MKTSEWMRQKEPMSSYDAGTCYSDNDWEDALDEVIKLEATAEACKLYLKTGTPFARAALERALEELE